MLQTNPMLSAAACCVALVLAIEVWWLHAALARLAEMQTARLELGRESERLSRMQPAPTAATLAAIESELAAVRYARASLAARFAVTSPDRAADVSESVADSARAFFAAAGFEDRLRRLAAQRGVTVPADARFDFSPGNDAVLEPEEARQREQERAALEPLLTRLLEAQPREFLGLTRVAEDPRAPDRSTLVLRFSATTEVLRVTLNSLADSNVPLFIRSLAVTPLAAADDANSAVPNPDARRKVVARTPSRFELWLDFREIPAEAADAR